MTTLERAQARADLVAYIKAIPCARPEDALRIATKYRLQGLPEAEVIAGLKAAVQLGIAPLDAINPSIEGSE
jgi:hypothetical protein